MTFSGNRQQSRFDAAEFVARLARETSLSQRAIIREARQRGFRIGNDLARAYISASRGALPTPRQTQSLLNISVRTFTNQIPEAFSDALGRAVREATRDIRLNVNIRLEGIAGFQYNNGNLDSKTEEVELQRSFTIRADQIESFNRNIPNLISGLTPQLIQQAVVPLMAADKTGAVVLVEEPELTIIRVNVAL